MVGAGSGQGVINGYRVSDGEMKVLGMERWYNSVSMPHATDLYKMAKLFVMYIIAQKIYIFR